MLLLHLRKYDVHYTLEGSRSVFYSKRHPRALKKAMMRGKCRFVNVSVVHFCLPVARVGFEVRKHFSFSQRINSFFHPRNWVAISFCDGNETQVVDTKSQATVLPGRKQYRRGQFCYGGFSHASLEHLLYFLALEFSCFRTGAVRCRVHGWRICRIQHDTVHRNINSARKTVPKRFVYFHHCQKEGFDVHVLFVILNCLRPGFIL